MLGGAIKTFGVLAIYFSAFCLNKHADLCWRRPLVKPQIAGSLLIFRLSCRRHFQRRRWHSHPWRRPMVQWTPDPTFYPSPRLAAKAPAETVAFVAAFDPERKVPDALAVVDVDTKSKSYLQIVGNLSLKTPGDELHHFGWNACSSCLCPNAPHPHVERRYLIVPGVRSSRVYVIDTKPDPRNPKFHKIIEPEELIETTGYSRPHTVHCGPDGIYVSALGNATGDGLCSGQITGAACISGICTSASICRKSISGLSTSSCSSSGRRTIRPRPTASSTPWSASRTSRLRSGPGIGTGTNGR